MAFDIFQYFWCGCFVIWKRNHLSIILLECMYLISFSPIFYPQRVPIFFGYCFHIVIKLLRIRSSLCTLPSWRSVSFTIIWLFSIDTTSNWKTTDTRAVGLFKSFQCLTLKWNHRMTPASCSPFLQTELSLYKPACTCKKPSRIGAPYLQYLSCGSGSS